MTTAYARSSILLAEGAVVLMALIWGINYSVIKYGTSAIQPVAFNGVRVVLAALALLIIAVAWGGRPPARRDLLALLALGVLGNGIYQILFAEGIARTRAGEAALVVGGSPALVALLGRVTGVETPTRYGVIGIALSIFGVALIVLARANVGSGPHGGTLLGDLLVLIGSICWAVYTILLVPYTQRLNGFWVVALSMLGGSLVLLAIGARAIASVDWSAVSSAVWGSILYGGLGGLVVAYILWYRGVQVLGPTRTSVVANLQPFIALMFAWLTLGETPTVWQAIGAATIVAGVLLTRIRASTET